MSSYLNLRSDFVNGKKWRANRICCPDAGKGAYYTYFRKVLNLGGDVRSATLDITADRFYKLYVNGKRVSEGPIRAAYHYWSYDTLDLTDFLSPGENVICALVSQWDPWAGKTISLLAQLELDLDNGEHITIGTDSSWKYRSAQGWRHDAPTVCWIGHIAIGYVEVRDLRADDEGCLLPGFDDAQWQLSIDSADKDIFRSAESRGPYAGQFRTLLARDIPPLESAYIYPRVIKTGEVKGTEVLCAKGMMSEFLWVGLDDVEPASRASVSGAEDFAAGEKPLAMQMVYEGEIYGTPWFR